MTNEEIKKLRALLEDAGEDGAKLLYYGAARAFNTDEDALGNAALAASGILEKLPALLDTVEHLRARAEADEAYSAKIATAGDAIDAAKPDQIDLLLGLANAYDADGMPVEATACRAGAIALSGGTVCAYCEWSTSPLALTDEARDAETQAHIRTCAKHPMSAALARADAAEQRVAAACEILTALADPAPGEDGDSMHGWTAAARRFVEDSSAVVAPVQARIAELEREADRLRHGVGVEGDFVCPDSLRADAAEQRVAALEAALREYAHAVGLPPLDPNEWWNGVVAEARKETGNSTPGWEATGNVLSRRKSHATATIADALASGTAALDAYRARVLEEAAATCAGISVRSVQDRIEERPGFKTIADGIEEAKAECVVAIRALNRRKE